MNHKEPFSTHLFIIVSYMTCSSIPLFSCFKNWQEMVYALQYELLKLATGVNHWTISCWYFRFAGLQLSVCQPCWDHDQNYCPSFTNRFLQHWLPDSKVWQQTDVCHNSKVLSLPYNQEIFTVQHSHQHNDDEIIFERTFRKSYTCTKCWLCLQYNGCKNYLVQMLIHVPWNPERSLPSIKRCNFIPDSWSHQMFQTNCCFLWRFKKIRFLLYVVHVYPFCDAYE